MSQMTLNPSQHSHPTGINFNMNLRVYWQTHHSMITDKVVDKIAYPGCPTMSL